MKTRQDTISSRKRHRERTQRQCKTAYNSYVSDIVTSEGKSTKKMWSFVMGNICDSSGISSLKKDGIAYSDHMVNASF